MIRAWVRLTAPWDLMRRMVSGVAAIPVWIGNVATRQHLGPGTWSPASDGDRWPREPHHRLRVIDRPVQGSGIQAHGDVERWPGLQTWSRWESAALLILAAAGIAALVIGGIQLQAAATAW